MSTSQSSLWIWSLCLKIRVVFPPSILWGYILCTKYVIYWALSIDITLIYSYMWDLTSWAHIWCVSGFVLKTGCYRVVSEQYWLWDASLVKTGRFKVYKLLQKPLLYEPWYFLLYYISTLVIYLYLGAYFEVFVLIFTPWFDMLLELSLITFLHNLKTSLRIVTPSTMRTIVSQVESMIELCTFSSLLNCHYASACFEFL